MNRLLTIFGFAAWLAGIPAGAQTLTNPVSARIPFEFRVGDTVMAPGVYSFSTSGSSPVLFVRRPAGQAVMRNLAGSAHRTSGSQRAVVVFQRYGDRYFLIRIFSSGLEEGVAVNPSRVSRETISRYPHPVEVVIAAD